MCSACLRQASTSAWPNGRSQEQRPVPALAWTTIRASSRRPPRSGRRHGSHGVLLAGHSLGGTLAAIFAALHPELVEGLVLIEAPLHLGPGIGALGALAATTPGGPEAMRAAFDVVPGTVLSTLGSRRTRSSSCAHGGSMRSPPARPEAAATHLRVLRWALDELAMPGPCSPTSSAEFAGTTPSIAACSRSRTAGRCRNGSRYRSWRSSTPGPPGAATR